MTKYIIITAGIFGFAGILLSSLSAHAIKPMLIENGAIDSFHAAQNLLLIHAITALAVAILAHIFSITLFNFAGLGFLLGSLLFSLPIFLRGFNITTALHSIIPFGGGIMMLSWILLVIAAFKIRI